MSYPPPPRFKDQDTVVDVEKGLMGTVNYSEWQEVVHSYTYEYECRYKTDKIQGPDTVWVKVNPTKKYAAEHVLEKFVNNGDSSEAAEAGEAGEAGQ
ncbi:hypothetical protein UCDDA912_g00910 [Diaporthe ampelina]|uniref:Uncharacterized protein n=1 Tax=Diaporthe ampelina TaxID=1214573 RepID=A0A0G2HW87_9PEZI|nr:hypothetical protein UCDDA912_g00910 [Diaporthe ampelina]